MASNQTSSYGLSQWEATDQVKRTDFNADNAKIDAALETGKRQGYHHRPELRGQPYHCAGERQGQPN